MHNQINEFGQKISHLNRFLIDYEFQGCTTNVGITYVMFLAIILRESEISQCLVFCFTLCKKDFAIKLLFPEFQGCRFILLEYTMVV